MDSEPPYCNMDNITILDYHAIWYICTQMLNFQHVFDQIPNWKSLLRKRQNCNGLKGDDDFFLMILLAIDVDDNY